MKKSKIIITGTIFVAILMAICPMSFAMNFEKQASDIQKTTVNTMDLDIEILDISYNGWEITVTIKNHGTSGIRTMFVRFFVSYFIQGDPTMPILIREDPEGIDAEETIDTTVNWWGRGHFILYVDVVGHDQESKEIWYPKSKTNLFNFSLLEQLFQCPIFTKLLNLQ